MLVKRADGRIVNKRGTWSTRAGDGRWFRTNATRQARSMRAAGMTYREVAEALGCSVFTAYYVANPKAFDRWRSRARAAGRY